MQRHGPAAVAGPAAAHDERHPVGVASLRHRGHLAGRPGNDDNLRQVTALQTVLAVLRARLLVRAHEGRPDDLPKAYDETRFHHHSQSRTTIFSPIRISRGVDGSSAQRIRVTPSTASAALPA